MREFSVAIDDSFVDFMLLCAVGRGASGRAAVTGHKVVKNANNRYPAMVDPMVAP